MSQQYCALLAMHNIIALLTTCHASLALLNAQPVQVLLSVQAVMPVINMLQLVTPAFAGLVARHAFQHRLIIFA